MPVRLPMRLWRDVPPEERMDHAYLLTRGGGTNPKWVAKQLRHLAATDGCQAAVFWVTGEKRWKKCSHKAAPGESFCPHHGGPHFRTPKPYVRKMATPDEARAILTERIRKKSAQLKELQTQIDKLSAELVTIG